MMQTFEVRLADKRRGELILFSEAKQAGKMDIFIRHKLLTVYHTEVDAIHAGKGYAKLLLDELVRKAREEGLMIKPLCPYVHGQFKKNPDTYADIWWKQD
ncbi:GNAT family N-acetyltransferase [Sphingobacterium bambusae]|uniref:GNAT family N-acetyltransferase n=1 Tax=Sphingobacterium bambusae TaxID=662858 RepID=A0ABW6BN11_9SPHI|nr:GNAT family N-acetyltransferase [Sphingobacterium bambusae]WPL47808.1 GNAT family N-acetyltransferase [Sphingobacterium bambusae]